MLPWDLSDPIPYHCPLPCSIRSNHTGLLSNPPTNQAYIPSSEHLLFSLPEALLRHLKNLFSHIAKVTDTLCLKSALATLYNTALSPHFSMLLYFSPYLLPLNTAYTSYFVYCLCPSTKNNFHKDRNINSPIHWYLPKHKWYPLLLFSHYWE